MTAILRFLLIRQLNMVNVSPLPRTTTWVAPGRTTWVLACAGRSTWVPACAGTGLDDRPLNQYPPAPAKAGAQYRNHLRGIKLTGPRPAQPLGLCAGRSTWVPACAGTGRVKWFAMFSCRINNVKALSSSKCNNFLKRLSGEYAFPYLVRGSPIEGFTWSFVHLEGDLVQFCLRQIGHVHAFRQVVTQ